MSLSDEELSKAMEAWNLETDNKKRTPYKRVSEKKGDSIPVACRCDSLMVRRMDEVIGLQDPSYKTRSDIVQDAIAMWLEDWDIRHPDVITALTYQFKVEQMGRRRSARSTFLEMAKKELDGLRDDSDIMGLHQFVQTLDTALMDLREDAPASFLRKVDDIRTSAKRLIGAGKDDADAH